MLKNQLLGTARHHMMFFAKDDVDSAGISDTPDASTRDAVSSGLDAAIAEDLGTGAQEQNDEEEEPPAEEEPPKKKEDEEEQAEEEEPLAEEEPPKKKEGEEAPEGETPTEKQLREEKEKAERDKQGKVELSDDKGKITMPKGMHPRQETNWRRLETVAQTATARLAELEPVAAKVPELEQALEEAKKNPQLPDEIKHTVEEAEKIRSMFFLEQSEEFQQKYDGAVKTIEDNIYGIFTKYKMPAETIEKIKAMGGPTKIPEKWLKENVLDKVGMVEGQRIQKGLIDIFDLQSAKEKELGDAKENAGKYLKDREEADEKQFQADQGVIDGEIDKAIKELPWAQEKQVPAGASAADKQAIEAHNAEVKKFRSIISAALFPNTPNLRAQVAIAAAVSGRLAADMGAVVTDRDELKKKLDAANLELSKLKKKGALPSREVKPPTRKPSEDGPKINENSQTAISRGLDEELGEQ